MYILLNDDKRYKPERDESDCPAVRKPEFDFQP
jgi:hypothetical protein